MQDVQRRLALDRVALLEVDMGAHMWWSGFEVVDMAGLVDVPMGHHKWEKPFVREYVYSERNPSSPTCTEAGRAARACASTRSGAATWRVDPFPVSQWSQHPGCHVRKDLFVDKEFRAEFADASELPGRHAVRLVRPRPEGSRPARGCMSRSTGSAAEGA